VARAAGSWPDKNLVILPAGFGKKEENPSILTANSRQILSQIKLRIET
jgi:hypothetical protein